MAGKEKNAKKTVAKPAAAVEETAETEAMVCEDCGTVHHLPAPPEDRGDELKLIALCAGGVLLIALLWVWIFKFGVPLVKSMTG